MKKLVLGLSLTLAALAFLLSPAMAETNASQAARTLSAADRAFLQSLASMPIAPAAASKRPGNDPPPVGENALCSATANCWDGSTRSCQGYNSTVSCTAVDSNCPGQRGYVTCDGTTTLCPACPPGSCGEDWCQDEDACAISCSPCDYTYTCNATYCTDRCRCIFSTCPI